MKITKSKRLLDSLKFGAELTPRQIKAMFNIANPSAAVDALRKEGYCIYGNPTKLAGGTKTTKYRLGTPTRGMVAAAAAMGYFAK